MPLAFPYTAYPGVGSPVTFYVGPDPSTRFDVHHFLLSKVSPLFTLTNGLPRIINEGIELPAIEPQVFHDLFLWLYERKPPVYKSDRNLLSLMKLWVLAGELGIWKTQNTVLRLGMELMQSKDFVCTMESVRWVYEHTPPSSPLRNYIITIFCQRGPPVTTSQFSSENEKLGILRDASSFMRVLGKVRAGNPKGVHGYDLPKEFPVEYSHTPSRDGFTPGQMRGTLVMGGKEVDWSRIEYPLPKFLVWGENWEVLPDMHFVEEENAIDSAKDVGRQIGIPEKLRGRWG